MRATDFAEHLTRFLTMYLPAQKNASKNTIASYRDTFKLLLQFCGEQSIPVEKLTMNILNHSLIMDFLVWLEEDRGCSISTRNQRLAALHSFFRYAQYEEPAGLANFQKVISIPIKRAPKPTIPFLTTDAMQLLLSQPDKSTPKGRRDLTLLAVLYDSGCRVQELIDLRVCDVIIAIPMTLVLTGKGNKTRRVPLMTNTSLLVENYIRETRLKEAWKSDFPLFANKRLTKLTREGVTYIIAKYVALARRESHIVPEKVTPHMFRHSKSMHLLRAGVNLIYIRDFLGHEDIKTTEIYAKCDTELKRQAIENAYPGLINSNLPDWTTDNNLLDWLSSL
jgi:site-specific recombinase XerD